MEITIFLARVFGVYLITLSLIMLLRLKIVQSFFDETMKNAGTIHLTGLLTLILGAVLVALHPTFIPDWTGLVTVICYLVLLKGFLTLAAFPYLINLSKNIVINPLYMYILAIILLVLGIFLSYQGFSW